MAVYGLDIGGTKIETAIFDDKLNLISCWRVKTPTTNYQEFLSTIHQQVLKADGLSKELCPVGIGMPGLINDQGQVLSANVPCATHKYIAKDLLGLLNRPIAIKNDTRCFALSESNNGAGEGSSRVFGAIIGTGAAGGLCINGHLENTKLGVAGEYGHIPLSAMLQKKYNLPILTCGCGLIGCVESYIAGPGVTRLYQHFYGQTVSAIQWNENLQKNDVLAQQVLDCYLDILAETFAVLCKLQEPDIIVLGGGISLVDSVIDGLPNKIEQHLFNGFKAPKVVRAKFGDSSGVRGAAILGMQNVKKS